MKIDLVEEGPEATRLAAGLTEAGFDVTLRGIADLLADESSAQLLIVSGDGLGVVDFLRRRTQRGGLAQPTFIIGSPDGLPIAGGMARDLGCTRYFPRPLSVPRLVERVQELRERLGAPEKVSEIREPTVRLRDESVSGVSGPDESTVTGLKAELTGMRSRASAALGTESGVFSEAPGDVEPAISVRLLEMLRQADNRIFPGQPAVDLYFAAGDETARDLVSPILLEDISLPIETVEDEFSGFTMLGADSVISSSAASEVLELPSAPVRGTLGGLFRENTVTEGASGSRSVVGPKGLGELRRVGQQWEEPQERQSSPTIDALELGEPSADGLGRRGEIADAGVLRLLWIIVRRKLDVRVTLELGEGIRLALTMRGGRLTRVSGPVATRVFDGLRRDGLASSVPADEAQAQRLLEERVAEGRLSRFEYHRRRALARQYVLHEAVASRGGTFLIRPLSEQEAGEPIWATLVRGGLAAVLVEGARQRLDVSRVRRLLSKEEGVMVLGPEAPARFLEAAVEPEVVALLMDYEGATLDAILTAGPAHLGIPGLLFALVGITAVNFRAGAPKEILGAMEPVELRRAIKRLHDIALTQDYFRVLNLSPEASSREVHAAYSSRVGHVKRLVVGPGTPLAAQQEEVLAVMADALRVLRVPHLRDAYRQALYPGRRDKVEAPTSPGFFPQ